jgi:hypothetical protein
MVNNRSKMLRSQEKVKRMLEQDGYLVHIIHHTRWYKDIFGHFDGFAIKDGKVYFLQIKSNSWSDFEDFREFCDENKLNGLFFNVEDRAGVKSRLVIN